MFIDADNSTSLPLWRMEDFWFSAKTYFTFVGASRVRLWNGLLDDWRWRLPFFFEVIIYSNKSFEVKQISLSAFILKRQR